MTSWHPLRASRQGCSAHERALAADEAWRHIAIQEPDSAAWRLVVEIRRLPLAQVIEFHTTR